MTWFWDKDTFDYTDDDGAAMGREKILAFSRTSIQASTDKIDLLAMRVAEGLITPEAWHEAMREELKGEYIRQYLLGRGGRNQMTQEDWGSVGGSLAEQYRWLTNFADQVAGGNLTEGQIKVRGLLELAAIGPYQGVRRSAMYVNSAREAFFRAQARARGFQPSDLPYMPADGDTICLTRCNCSWDYVPVYEDGVLAGWDCYWKLGGNPQHCDSCIARATESAPYQIRF